ncbi:4'-phosphopantetheinyl transferase superfamily protein [Streptomyces sp. NBC_01591]|uniref:4'-phosphopantetheinyl transferase family protein n=1 Tax=Streptomyces sp. NBC_01591 TaxID=2975888 RepID=UPI002DDAB0EF|nr:4'-phosphopantetheinyl transferase superfamily protein [Streptomyces sp. NBC_01591]WSD70587.1 4'-phosphopantetheinyl transferase superfamily protein [Streptomyces sp. NBC_01591]
MNALLTPSMTEALVHWWPIASERPDPADLALLDTGELERLSRIGHPRQAAQFAGSRAGARRVLARLLQVSPHELEFGRLPCPGCGDRRHGPPAVARPASPFRISLSHSEGCCLLAIARTPVGVDVEGVRDMDTEELGPVALTAAEQRHVRTFPPGSARHRAFLRCWTRKEAVLKAVGTGITTDLATIETHPGATGPATVVAGVPGTPGSWAVSDLATPGNWVATVALPSDVSMSVSLRHPPQFRFQIS